MSLMKPRRRISARQRPFQLSVNAYFLSLTGQRPTQACHVYLLARARFRLAKKDGARGLDSNT